MDKTTLVGRSILVIEEQPFVTRCLQILLEGEGAKVHCAANAVDGLRIMDKNRLSAAVLDCSSSAKGRRRIAQQLARIDLPFVVCQDADHDEFWPGSRVLTKPVMGIQLIEMLCRFIRTQDIRTNASGATPVLRPVPPKAISADGY